MSKRHWNTIILDGTVADDEVQEWIEHSYDLVVAKLPRHRRDALRALMAWLARWRARV